MLVIEMEQLLAKTEEYSRRVQQPQKMPCRQMLTGHDINCRQWTSDGCPLAVSGPY